MYKDDADRGQIISSNFLAIPQATSSARAR
jgi:hypothetical protein